MSADQPCYRPSLVVSHIIGQALSQQMVLRIAPAPRVAAAYGLGRSLFGVD